eukprot:jgi/Ulvmu1/3463/UM016_0083.1
MASWPALLGIFLVSILTLVIGTLSAVTYYATYTQLVLLGDSSEAYDGDKPECMPSSLRGLRFSCIFALMASVMAISPCIVLIWRLAWQAPLAAVAKTRRTLTSVLSWVALLVLQASMTLSGYDRAMQRWEVDSDSEYAFPHCRTALIPWSRTYTTWARLAYTSGFVAFAWYSLLGLFLEFVEPRVRVLEQAVGMQRDASETAEEHANLI